MKKKSLISIVNPHPNSTILVYDVHASESGALAILNDFYNQIIAYKDKSIKWVFIVSTPKYQNFDNIIVERYPWVKKGWFYRYYFNKITTRSILDRYKPDKVFSLQNEGITFFNKEQIVYLHLPFILTDHKFRLKEDGKTLWLYQNVLSKIIFKSLRRVNCTIVQTQWMKNALVNKAHVAKERIEILEPDITSNKIGLFLDSPENRKSFFYPATAFSYKNHKTLFKAIKYAQDRGLTKYEVLLTIKSDENRYAKKLYSYVKRHNLNVIFGGPIPRDKVFKKYTNSILLFPSYVESFGLPLLEARMTGTFIVASDTPYCREILNGYNKAFFFPEMDYETMGKHILELQNYE